MAARRAQDPPPPARLAELERELAGDGRPARGYLVRGEERWFRDAAVSLLVEAGSRAGFEVARHDAADPDFDLAVLLADLGAPSLFAPARLVLVRSVGALLKKEADSPSPFAAGAAAFLRGRAVPGSLVLEADSVRIDHPVAKAVIEAGGSVLSFHRLYESPPPWERDPDPRKAELVQWLLSRARLKSIRLDAAEAAYVAAATGNDLYALDSALDALKVRGERGVRDSVGWTGGASPFQVAEDLLRGDAGAAIAGIEALFRSGMRERDGSREVKPEAVLAVLLGSLRSKLRAALAASRAGESGAPLPIATAPKVREEIEGRAALRSSGAWTRMLDDLAGIERGTRTSRTVDASDLVLLALRWRRDPGRIRAPAAARWNR
jgi:DNA polymerase III delta subunit